MAKIQTSCSIEPELHERLRLVALVSRRSLAEVVADCIRLALPELEAELQRPRLSPEILARLKAGEKLEEVLATSLAPFAPRPAPPAATLNESPAPYRAAPKAKVKAA